MSFSIKNRRITLAERPSGLPNDDCWNLMESQIQSPGVGEILVRVIYVSIDPAMRGWLNDAKSYIEPVAIGDTMRALGLGQVVESGSDKFQVGDYVTGMLGVQECALITVDSSIVKVDPDVAPLPAHLSVLGMTGMTAYFGLLNVGLPKPGDTVLISGAAGAVGALVGQIAKIKGCRVIGVAGGKAKCNHLTQDLGFDAVIDYKSEDALGTAVADCCPDGIDLFFDNVGGEILEVALGNLAHGARVVICGAISQYNKQDSFSAPVDYLPILINSARMEGFVVLDFAHRYGEALKPMAGWLQSEQLHSREDIREGLENFPNTLLHLFNGENFGKLILKVGEEC